jgi:hypothetical protein
MGTGDRDSGVIAAVIAGNGGSGSEREGDGVVGVLSLIESLVPVVHLIGVMVLEADVGVSDFLCLSHTFDQEGRVWRSRTRF